jgi:hypothetical protein
LSSGASEAPQRRFGLAEHSRSKRVVSDVKGSDTFRENADNCLLLAEKAASEPASNRYRRMAQAWTALAQEQDWLDGHPAQTTTDRASELAEGTIDRLSEEGASSDDVKSRKRRLIDGPAEFRDTRIDNN